MPVDGLQLLRQIKLRSNLGVHTGWLRSMLLHSSAEIVLCHRCISTALWCTGLQLRIYSKVCKNLMKHLRPD